jgi:hypothetical protein
MGCYKRLSPSREALFAMRGCKVSALLLSRGSKSATYFSNWRSIMLVKSSQVFFPYRTETF